MKQRKQLNFTKALLAVYMVMLIWTILFKMQTDFSVFFEMGYRNINWIPFQGSVIANGRLELKEIILNVLIFVPFGVYVSILYSQWGFWKKAALAFCTSFALEAIQYILGIGATDITDLLGNTLGGIIGILFFELLSKLLKENTIKFINIIAAIGTVFIVGMSLLLVLANG